MYYRKTSLVIIFSLLLTTNIFANGDQYLGAGITDLLVFIAGVGLSLRSRVGWKYRIAILMISLLTVRVSFYLIDFMYEKFGRSLNNSNYFLWTIIQFIVISLIFTSLCIISEKYLKKKQANQLN